MRSINKGVNYVFETENGSLNQITKDSTILFSKISSDLIKKELIRIKVVLAAHY